MPLPGDLTPAAPPLPQALALYERARQLQLTDEQSAMVRTKSEQAEKLAAEIEDAGPASPSCRSRLEPWLERY